MIIARSHGRLGNQLFHFAAIEGSRIKGEWLVLIGFSALNRLISLDLRNRVFRIPNPDYLNKPLKSLERVLRKIAHSGVFGQIVEDKTAGKIARTSGRVNVAVVDAGNYQEWKYFGDRLIAHLRERIIDGAGQSEENKPAEQECFVHVRRGDYLSFPSLEESSSLPDSWYRRAMEIQESVEPDTVFVVYSDDPDYARAQFADMKNVHIVEAGETETFLAMISFRRGILSASTFSLWASIVARSSGAPGPFIGPTYWLGWRKNEWNPTGLRHWSITYLPVNEESP